MVTLTTRSTHWACLPYPYSFLPFHQYHFLATCICSLILNACLCQIFPTLCNLISLLPLPAPYEAWSCCQISPGLLAVTYPEKLCLAFPWKESLEPSVFRENSCLPKEADRVAEFSLNLKSANPNWEFHYSTPWSSCFGSNRPSPSICSSWRQSLPEICLGMISLVLHFYIL